MRIQSGRSPGTVRPDFREAGHYRWVALMNTTMAVFMSSLDGSIILIALPAIFNGIHLDPLAPRPAWARSLSRLPTGSSPTTARRWVGRTRP
jgi:hypothetical protein